MTSYLLKYSDQYQLVFQNMHHEIWKNQFRPQCVKVWCYISSTQWQNHLCLAPPVVQFWTELHSSAMLRQRICCKMYCLHQLCNVIFEWVYLVLFMGAKQFKWEGLPESYQRQLVYIKINKRYSFEYRTLKQWFLLSGTLNRYLVSLTGTLWYPKLGRKCWVVMLLLNGRGGGRRNFDGHCSHTSCWKLLTALLYTEIIGLK